MISHTSSSAFAHNSNIVRVPSKPSNVLLDPLKRYSLVSEAIITQIACLPQFFRGKKSEHAEAVASERNQLWFFHGGYC